MILVLLEWGKDALSSKVKKDNCWSEQSPENRLYRLFRFLWATRYTYQVTKVGIQCCILCFQRGWFSSWFEFASRVIFLVFLTFSHLTLVTETPGPRCIQNYLQVQNKMPINHIRHWRPFVNSAPLSWMQVHAEALRTRTNVVYFRVMRRLCRREWNWLCENQHTMTTDKGSRRVTSYSNSVLPLN